MVKRWLCVALPAWPIDLARRRLRRDGSPDNLPLLLFVPHGQQQLVTAACERCPGVSHGMTLSHARALTGPALVQPAEAPADARALTRLAEWATRWSPIVAPDTGSATYGSARLTLPAFESLLLDITGCQRLFRGEDALARQVRRELARRSIHARVGLGPTIGHAWALAWFGDQASPENPPPSSHSATLPLCHSATSPLPTAALRLDNPTLEALSELGIDTIGQLRALPRRELPSRFGAQLLHRLGQLLGTVPENIQPVRVRPPLRVERAFDGPVTNLDAVELAVRELTDELCRALLRTESGLRRLDAVFEGGAASRAVGAPARARESRITTVTLSIPSRNPRHLWSLLRPRLDRLRLGFGVESICLIAARTTRVRHQQAEYLDHPPAHPQAHGELLDTLVNRLGPGRALRAVPVESHLPHRAFRFEEALAHEGRPPEPVPTISPHLRPTLLLDPPEPATVIALQPDRPPTLLRWRNQERLLTLGIGPERIASEWWRADGDSRACLDARDYYRIRDYRGLWLWVYRDLATARWFVHALWA